MNIRHIIPGLLGIVLCVCLSCKYRTIEPSIPAGERVVLIEEFTGKGCTNCPKGSRELENLLSLYQDQLVVVSIHANFFADPHWFPIGQYDLRTDEGEELFNFLGPNYGYPAGVINRRKYNNDFQQAVNVWSGLVEQEAQAEPLVEFTIVRTYDATSRHLHLMIEGRAKSDIPDETRISIMITEDGIVDAQDVFEEGGIVEDYVHNHVLRDMLTPYDGQILDAALASAEEFAVEFSYTLPDHIIAEAAHVIAFISLNTTSGDVTVLQAGVSGITE
jgi:hypothetical protein